MKVDIGRLAWLAAAALVLAVAAHAKQPRIIEGSWIIELESAPTVEFPGGQISTLMDGPGRVNKPLAATAPALTGVSRLDVESPAVKAYAAHLDAERAEILDQAAFRLGREITPRHVYRHLFNGFSARLDPAEAQALSELPGVRSVTPDYRHELHTDASAEWIGANLYWAGTGGVPNPNRGEGMVLGVIDTGINWEHDYFKATSPTDNFTIVNPRDGFVGLCSKPEVECNGKLIGVYDFTDEGTDGRDIDGHGSHVASIAVGNRLDFSLEFVDGIPITFRTSGIAPRASLITYKACDQGDPDDNDDDGGCPSSALLQALEQALADQVDAVNYSIGTTGTTPSPWSGFESGQNTVPRVFLNLRDAGIVPVTSAGNSGPGPSTVSSPANAPWTVAVANATHDRRLLNRLINVTGGPFALGTLNGEGLTEGLGSRPIVHARDFGNALCGTGTPELQPTCEAHTGSSNPFPPGTFSGQIVVCDRGTYGRIEKGFNVRAAGAGGMILANDSEFGEILNADRHCLPATHVGESDGDRLRQWLASGSNHAGALSGVQRVTSAEFGGRLATSSSSGPPTGAPDVMKPNLTAPGLSILGASDTAGEIAFLSGTSMSSPQVAGAALLLRKSHPAWAVNAVISALETTARPQAVVEGDGSPAAVNRRGAGGARVNDAGRIGLYLPVTRQQFIDANPDTGGVPGDLNLPGILSENCIGLCTFTRRVLALTSGTWTVTTTGDLNIEVEPTAFTLGAGQQRDLTVTIRPGTVQVGQWGQGSVVLTGGPSGTAAQRLPVGARISAGILPADRNISASRNRGQSTISIDELGSLPEAVFRSSPLVKPDRTTRFLRQDPTPDNPYSGGEGTGFVLVDVPAETLMLYAETVFSNARDIDLFVGRDDNGNGQPELAEERCRSISPDELELCIIENPEPGKWWVLIQNWDASSATAQDRVDLEVAVLTASGDPSFFAAGPGSHPGGPLTLPIFWDQPAMRFGERWIGALGVSTNPDALANVGVIPVRITRNQQNQPQDTALFPGQGRAVVLPGAVSHNRLFVDVSGNATRIEVDVIGGSGLDATIGFRPFADLAGFEPATPAAPGARLDNVSKNSINNGFRLALNAPAGGTLNAGRYYVVLENSSGSETGTEVTVRVTDPRDPELVRGLFSPANRSTFQGIEWQQIENLGFILWYTYEEDGTPAFYISDGAPVSPDQSSWSAPVLRVTSNGVRQTPNVVGTASITAVADDDLIFSWRINGEHGSERMALLAANTCVGTNDGPQHLLGTWTVVGAREGGASVALNQFAEAWIRYYFDQTGRPRWVQYASGVQQGESVALEVLDFRGFCPYCDESEPDFEAVGVAQRQFSSELTATETVDFVSRPPLNTDYSRTRELNRLSSVEACPP